MKKTISVVMVAVALSGCAAMRSTIPSLATSASGPVYYLPTTRIMLTVTVDAKGEQLVIEAAQPEYIGDPSAAFTLSSVSNPFGSDKFKTKVANNGLLQSVELESTGELDEALVHGATSFGKVAAFLENAQAGDGRTVIFQEYIDPYELVMNPTRLTELQNGILGAVKAASSITATSDVDVKKAKTDLKIDVERLIEPAAGVDSSACKMGICYRRLIPYTISATVGGIKKETLIQVPNGSPTYIADMTRGLFSDWNTQTVFDKGMLTQYDSDRKSEAVEVLQLPGELVGAVVTGATSGFQSKTSLLNAEAGLLESKAEYLEKKKAVEERIATVNNPAAAALALEAGFVAQGSPLFSFVFGKPKTPATVVKPINIGIDGATDGSAGGSAGGSTGGTIPRIRPGSSGGN